MRLIDLSQPALDGFSNCRAQLRVSAEITTGHEFEGWHLEHFTVASGTGRNIDAPLNKIARGRGIGDFSIKSFVARVVIVDLRDASQNFPIDAKILAERVGDSVEDAIVLLATGWRDRCVVGDEWNFQPPYLSPDGAEWIVRNKARAVGIDHCFIGGFSEPESSHTNEILLGAELWMLEELHFPEEIFAERKPMQLWVLPVNLSGFSGAFCRPFIAVL